MDEIKSHPESKHSKSLLTARHRYPVFLHNSRNPEIKTA